MRSVNTFCKLSLVVITLVTLLAVFDLWTDPVVTAADSPQAENALIHLRQVMDQYTSFYIYSDKNSIANNFVPSGWMGDVSDITFDEGETNIFHSGGNAIRITYTPTGNFGWTGIYWQQTKDNWGNIPNVGFNLAGVKQLTFWARGETGGEKAEFKVGGIKGQYPDSAQPARSTGLVTLSKEWQQYVIDLSGLNMSYVIGGFAWVANRNQNPNGATIYLDDIRFEGYASKLRLVESYVPIPNWVPPQPLNGYRNFYVYQDHGSPNNGFYGTGWMGDYGDIAVNENYAVDSHNGTAIRIDYSALTSQGQGWAGIYYQAPYYNWGDRTGGYDLTGAGQLTFWAKGMTGNEKIQFLLGGITGPFHDTTRPPVSTGVIMLANTWQQYTIDLTGSDLKHIIGGFAWTATKADNPTGASFLLDDIRYESATNAPSDIFTPPPFDTDSVNMLAAHTYDNALVLLAFAASSAPGDAERAKLLADSLVWAQEHDPLQDGRLRNVYYADQLSTNQGEVRFFPDLYGQGTTTGNAAWAMLALLNYYQKYGGNKYYKAAERLGEWIFSNTYSTVGPGGYTGGSVRTSPTPENATYKSTEHNLDVYVAFMKLSKITGNAEWSKRASYAKSFLKAMWNDVDGYFYTGTEPDGITINAQVLPLDVNTWGFLALGEINTYGRALTYAYNHHRATDGSSGVLFEGLDFNTDRDGIWWEGTSQMVIALWAQYYFSSGDLQTWSHSTAEKFQAELRKAQSSAPRTNGKGIVATSHDELTTGFNLPTGGPWYYYNRLHVGATAWFVFAELQYNPFWGISAATEIPVPPPDCSPAGIEFTYLPPYKSTGELQGRVTCVNPVDYADYKVAVYIYLPEYYLYAKGWWTKPYWNSPLATIRSDGTWSAKIVTGGIDPLATKVAAFLVPTAYAPPLASGMKTLPDELYQQAVAFTETERMPAGTFDFSGYTWQVKASETPVEPGPNYFANSADNVWLDAQWRLHLRVVNRNGQWYAAEVINTESLGFGVYSFTLASRVDQLDPNAVLGLFTRDDTEPGQAHRGVDIEFARWGATTGENAQYVVQPSDQPVNPYRFNLQLPSDRSSHRFAWSPQQIEFASFAENAPPSGLTQPVASWQYTGPDIPTPDNEQAHINLWLFNGTAPLDGKEVEIVLESFAFTPLSGQGASITVVKDAQPDNKRNFRFAGTLGTFRLDDITPDDGDKIANRQTLEVATGKYTVNEQLPTGWYLAAINCDSTTGAEVNSAKNSVDVLVNNGEQAICTFVNRRFATIQTRVYHDRNGSGQRNSGEPFLSGWTINIYDNHEHLLETQVTNKFGKANFNLLRTGQYTVCETPQSGWTNTQPKVVDPTYKQPCYALDIGSGQKATILFGNTTGQVTGAMVEKINDDGLTIVNEALMDADEDGYYAPFVDEDLDTPDLSEKVFLPHIRVDKR